MEGNRRIIQALAAAVVDERTAIHAYILKSTILGNQGYKGLAGKYMARAREEMVHLDALLNRILFLESTTDAIAARAESLPKVCDFKLDVEGMLEHDLALETAAVKSYNGLAVLAVELVDNGTRELAVKHLQDEEAHVNWLEEQLQILEDTGKQNYLSEAV
jgi:bacterioferritin